MQPMPKSNVFTEVDFITSETAKVGFEETKQCLSHSILDDSQRGNFHVSSAYILSLPKIAREVI